MGDDVGLDLLLNRLSGWFVLSAVPTVEATEVRLATPATPDSPVLARALLLVDPAVEASEDGPHLGGTFSLCGDQIDIAGWRCHATAVLAGQIVDTSIYSLIGPDLDPVGDPDGTVEGLLESATLIWPPPEDLPEPDRGFGPLEALTRHGLTSSPMIVAIESEAPLRKPRTFHLFVTPWAALETSSDVVDGQPSLVVAYLPVTEVLGRFLERTALDRHLSIGHPRFQAQRITVRTTYDDGSELVVGALRWDEHPDGQLTCSDGPRTARSLTSEVLALLPGGEVAPTPSDRREGLARGLDEAGPAR